MPRFILRPREEERRHAIRRGDHMLQPIPRVVPAAGHVDHLAGHRVEPILLMALPRDRVVAASLQLHELQQLLWYARVSVGADGELRRLDLAKLHAITAGRLYIAEIEPIVVRERP